ncbi:MAG TPA: hypothetical protein VKY41_10070 [Xanthomarina sp.]|nr:hypothetical protein [Xanthomarina sp.]
MKKLFLTAAIAVFGFSVINAQSGLKAGAHVALPIGDSGDYSSVSIGLDVAYLVAVSDQFSVGGATGFTNAIAKSYDFLGASIKGDDVQFVPVAGAARFNATEEFYVGADLGYAVGINDNNDGGFYYRPRVGYSFTDMIGANFSYTGISRDGGSWSTIGVGIEFSF